MDEFDEPRGHCVYTAELEPTKRAIVSLVGKFYDPLGFLSPVVINFKVFLQELYEAQLNWDDLLTGDLLARWKHLLRSLVECQWIIRIPRCYANPVQRQWSSYELCKFCDASLKAYAAVVYLRMESKPGCHINLVASRHESHPSSDQPFPD